MLTIVNVTGSFGFGSRIKQAGHHEEPGSFGIKDAYELWPRLKHPRDGSLLSNRKGARTALVEQVNLGLKPCYCGLGLLDPTLLLNMAVSESSVSLLFADQSWSAPLQAGKSNT